MTLHSESNKTIYPGQPNDEITQRVIFKHLISIAPFIFSIFILGIVGIVGVFYLGQNLDETTKYVPIWIINLGGFLFMAMLVFLFFGVIWVWRNNKIVITNEHIVDIDQMGIFNRKVSTLRLVEIQDISASVKGPIQTIFQYGTIIVQTAGERENFLFDYVPNPYELEHYILEIRKKYYEPEFPIAQKNPNPASSPQNTQQNNTDYPRSQNPPSSNQH